MRELIAYVLSNTKVQERTEDSGKHGDRGTKGLTMPGNADNQSAHRTGEKAPSMGTEERTWVPEEVVLCFLSGTGSKVTR